MGGIMSYAKPALFGLVAGLLAPKIPVLNSLPYSSVIAGAAGGYFARRTVVGAAVGAGSSVFLTPMVASVTSKIMGTGY